MKQLFLPLVIFCLGLAVAKLFFGIDIERLFEGFGSFLADILDGPD
jgi:hypothetical protein